MVKIIILKLLHNPIILVLIQLSLCHTPRYQDNLPLSLSLRSFNKARRHATLDLIFDRTFAPQHNHIKRDEGDQPDEIDLQRKDPTHRHSSTVAGGEAGGQCATQVQDTDTEGGGHVEHKRAQAKHHLLSQCNVVYPHHNSTGGRNRNKSLGLVGPIITIAIPSFVNQTIHPQKENSALLIHS